MHDDSCECLCSVCRPPFEDWGNTKPHCRAYSEGITSVRAWCEGIICPKTVIHSDMCACDCVVCRPGFIDWGNEAPHCMAYMDPFSSLLCPNAQSETYHRKECLMGTCLYCGISKFPICPADEKRCATAMVKWQTFECKTIDRKGKPMSRAKLALMKTRASYTQPGTLSLHNSILSSGCTGLSRGCTGFSRGCTGLLFSCTRLLLGCTGLLWGCTGLVRGCTGGVYVSVVFKIQFFLYEICLPYIAFNLYL